MTIERPVCVDCAHSYTGMAMGQFTHYCKVQGREEWSPVTGRVWYDGYCCDYNTESSPCKSYKEFVPWWARICEKLFGG
jgi:hypothetical protein